MLAKRIAAFGIALLLACSGAAAIGPTGEEQNTAAAAVLPPVQTADGTEMELFSSEAILMCAENGQVLAQRNADEQVPPASITKLMTALLALESGIDLNETLTVSYDACHNLERNSTHIALDTDEEVTLEQMLYALLVTSANDAANVIAEEVGGTQEKFAEMMTARAAELGCQNTNFSNAHGLDSPKHYTSARDMALIMQELLKYEQIEEICGTQVYTMAPTNKQKEERQLWNKQCLLRANSKFYYPDAIASKNGWTTNAGQTLVAAARRGGVTLIAVSMGANDNKYDKIRDTHTMFDYGFTHFEKKHIPIGEQIKAAEDALRATDTSALTVREVLVPQKKDYVLRVEADGIAVFSGDDKLMQFEIPEAPAVMRTAVGEEDLAPVEVEVKPEKAAFNRETGLHGLLRIAVIAAAVIIVLLILLCINRWRRVRRQRARIHAMRMRASQQAELRQSTKFYDDDLEQ